MREDGLTLDKLVMSKNALMELQAMRLPPATLQTTATHPAQQQQSIKIPHGKTIKQKMVVRLKNAMKLVAWNSMASSMLLVEGVHRLSVFSTPQATPGLKRPGRR